MYEQNVDLSTGEILDQAQQHEQEHAEYPPLFIEVTVKPVAPVKNLVGFADVKLNGAFVVRGFKVLTSDKGLFVGTPSRKGEGDAYQDIAFPITQEAREQLNAAVINGYNVAINKMREILYASDPDSNF